MKKKKKKVSFTKNANHTGREKKKIHTKLKYPKHTSVWYKHQKFRRENWWDDKES